MLSLRTLQMSLVCEPDATGDVPPCPILRRGTPLPDTPPTPRPPRRSPFSVTDGVSDSVSDQAISFHWTTTASQCSYVKVGDGPRQDPLNTLTHVN